MARSPAFGGAPDGRKIGHSEPGIARLRLDAPAGPRTTATPGRWSSTRDVRRGLTEVVPAGFVTQWERLHSLGIPVLAIRDNPRFSQSPPDCLQRRGRENPSCGVARAAVYSAAPRWTWMAVPPNVTFLDTAELLCGPIRCPAEVGNVLVYMDDNHISGTYAATLRR